MFSKKLKKKEGEKEKKENFKKGDFVVATHILNSMVSVYNTPTETNIISGIIDNITENYIQISNKWYKLGFYMNGLTNIEKI